MDAEKLIEEAARVSATRKWPKYLADLLDSLSAALRETTAREQATIASLRCAEGSLKEYAAANLAANQEIVRLNAECEQHRAELARLTTPRPIAEAPLWMPVNRDSAYGEPPRDVLDRHLRNGGLWLVEDSAAHAHRAIFRTWKHPTEDRICWADARGEGLFLGRPLLFAPLDIDCSRLPLPVLP